MPVFELRPDLQLHYDFDDFTDPWEQRPFLVLQHGNGRSSRFWYRWVPYLARHFRIIRPDMRGLGRSTGELDLDSDFTLENLLSDLVAVLDHAGARTVHFCGESMGGILGMAFAAQYPERIRSLTLVSTPVFIEQQMKDRYSLGHGSRVEAMQELGIKEWVAATTRTTRLPAEEQNAQQLLPQIEQPVLGLYPTEGQITSNAQEQLLREGLKNFEIVHLPTRYHMVQLLFPKECTDALIAFCNRVGDDRE